MTASDKNILLDYYVQELTYLRKMGTAFSSRYPKIAARLELSADECPDPHVERLLEAFAFLTGRIQYNIDSEFPRFTTALLDNLYPNYLQPIPSFAIAQFDVDPQQGQLTTGHLIPQHTQLLTHAVQGVTCRFRTCYPLTLWPLEITYAGVETTEHYPFLDSSPDVARVLRLRFSCRGTSLKQLKFNQLRLHLHGAWVDTAALYELLSTHILRVALLSPNSTQPVLLQANTIRPVGFEEAIIPYPLYAHPAYRLLQEYFAFPDKFLFFDLTQLDRLVVQEQQHDFDVLFLLNFGASENLHVDASMFRLGCTPIVNLFPKTSEPIRITHRQPEYRLIPDVRWERSTEIHSIIKVSAISDATDDTALVQPFFSFRHGLEGEQHRVFWYMRRIPTERADIAGTDVLLSFMDLDFNLQMPAHQTVFAHTLCTNRHLAEQMPAGAELQIEEVAPLHRIYCLKAPTPQLDPPLLGETVWRIVSHLSLNYLSLTEARASLPALQEILRLYSFATQQKSIDQQIAGIRKMTTRPVVRRLGQDAWRGFLRGTEITLEFDSNLYVGSSALLLASVLEYFFTLYVSANSFTQLVIKRDSQEGIWKQWPPRTPHKTLA